MGLGQLTRLDDGIAKRIGLDAGLVASLMGVLNRATRLLETLVLGEALLTFLGNPDEFSLQCQDGRRLLPNTRLASFGEKGLVTLVQQLLQAGSPLTRQLDSESRA